MEVSMVIAIIGCVLAIIGFFFNRKDKGEKDTETSSYKMRTDRNTAKIYIATNKRIVRKI